MSTKVPDVILQFLAGAENSYTMGIHGHHVAGLGIAGLLTPLACPHLKGAEAAQLNDPVILETGLDFFKELIKDHVDIRSIQIQLLVQILNDRCLCQLFWGTHMPLLCRHPCGDLMCNCRWYAPDRSVSVRLHEKQSRSMHALLLLRRSSVQFIETHMQAALGAACSVAMQDTLTGSSIDQFEAQLHRSLRSGLITSLDGGVELLHRCADGTLGGAVAHAALYILALSFFSGLTGHKYLQTPCNYRRFNHRRFSLRLHASPCGRVQPYSCYPLHFQSIIKMPPQGWRQPQTISQTLFWVNTIL